MTRSALLWVKTWRHGRGAAATVRRQLRQGRSRASPSGPLVELLPRHRPAAMPISVVMPTARLQPPRVRVLLEALVAMKRGTVD